MEKGIYDKEEYRKALDWKNRFCWVGVMPETAFHWVSTDQFLKQSTAKGGSSASRA